MRFIVRAELGAKKWQPIIIIPGGQPDGSHPYETELTPIFGQNRKLEKALSNGVKVALKQSNCTEILVIVR